MEGQHTAKICVVIECECSNGSSVTRVFEVPSGGDWFAFASFRIEKEESELLVSPLHPARAFAFAALCPASQQPGEPSAPFISLPTRALSISSIGKVETLPLQTADQGWSARPNAH